MVEFAAAQVELRRGAGKRRRLCGSWRDGWLSGWGGGRRRVLPSAEGRGWRAEPSRVGSRVPRLLAAKLLVRLVCSTASLGGRVGGVGDMPRVCGVDGSPNVRSLDLLGARSGQRRVAGPSRTSVWTRVWVEHVSSLAIVSNRFYHPDRQLGVFPRAPMTREADCQGRGILNPKSWARAGRKAHSKPRG